jgi:hypothetical protein
MRSLEPTRGLLCGGRDASARGGARDAPKPLTDDDDDSADDDDE